ncbi:MAG TPA: hypothetical protein VFE06_05675 [Acidobacteriaceae bacterium]|nr:hypothetical protein [Acidobacteriaceae bacterium]
MRFLVLFLLGCLGASVEAQDAEAPPDLLVEAGHCVATADGDWFDLSRDEPYSVELGYIEGEKSDSGGDPLYLIDFTTPTHSQGFGFAFETRGKGSHRELRLEFRTRFQQTVDGTQRVNLVDPPFGGVGTHDEMVAAIRQVGFHTWKVPVADLREGSRAVSCKTADAVR